MGVVGGGGGEGGGGGRGEGWVWGMRRVVVVVVEKEEEDSSAATVYSQRGAGLADALLNASQARAQTAPVNAVLGCGACTYRGVWCLRQ